MIKIAGYYFLIGILTAVAVAFWLDTPPSDVAYIPLTWPIVWFSVVAWAFLLLVAFFRTAVF